MSKNIVRQGMLIINADDFGKDERTTDNIVTAFREGNITSASAMVFMKDSLRAARIALEQRLEVGLHLNFDEQFTGDVADRALTEHQDSLGRFLTRSKYSQVLYNPFLRNEFEYSYKAQCDEFVRLYHHAPSHVNGHHHRHLCTNVLLGKLIPEGRKVRRSFTFAKEERNVANRLYRWFVDAIVERRFITTDIFFSAGPSESWDSVRKKLELARHRTAEMMVHASTSAQLDYLMSEKFKSAIHGINRGTYKDLLKVRGGSENQQKYL